MKTSYIVAAAWALLFIACTKWNIAELLSTKGQNLIGHEFYRLVTGLFVHRNLLHLLANTVALLFAGYWLEKHIGGARTLALSLGAAIVSQLAFSRIYRDSVFAGGSPIIFAMYGLTLACLLFRHGKAEYHLGTWYGNYSLAYALLANIPLFSKDASTLVIHLLALAAGFLAGCIMVTNRFI